MGNATHLSGLHGEGFVRTDSANFLPDGRITTEFGSGVPLVFTGTNGEKLSCQCGRTEHGASTVGMFELVPVPEFGPGIYVAFWIAEFVRLADERTGKYARVSGNWVMYAMSEPFLLGSDNFVDYSWQGEEVLTFPKGK